VGARRVVLFHHDPSREDAAMDRLVAEARQFHPDVVGAREGTEEVIS
jgi:phosphoribosyl 1,2-cyclic phosphodiesterase